MAAQQGVAYIEIRAKLDQLKRDLDQAEKTTKESTDRTTKTTGQKMSALGKSLTQTLTPAAAAIGLLAKQAFDEWDGGLDAIRAGTGATGEELEKLGESLKTVGGSVTQSLSETGETLAEVNKRTGLTGKSLEELTKNILDLNGRLGNQASVETVTRVFGDWSIKTKDQTEALDALFRTSQATGPSIDKLGELIVKYGAPLRQLGFGFEESAALMGKFEKEGVNTQLVLGSLRIALGKMAQQGVADPAEALEGLVEQIENAGSAGEANALALETFGARAGPDMAAAIREGRFELGKLFGIVKDGQETVEGAAEDTVDWSDKLVMLKNRAQAVVGPIGEVVAGVAGLVAVIGPAIWGLGKMQIALEGVEIAALGAKVALTGLAIGVPVAGFILLKDEVNSTAEGIAGFNQHLGNTQGLTEEGKKRLGEYTTATERFDAAIKGLNLDFSVQSDLYRDTSELVDINSVSQKRLNAAIAEAAKDVFVFGQETRGVNVHLDKFGNLVGAAGKKVSKTKSEIADFVKVSKGDMESWRQDVAVSVGTAGKDFTKLGEKASLSAEDIETALESMIDAQQDFRKNWKEVSKTAGKQTDDLVNFIAQRLGIDAPRATKILADSTNKEVKAILRDYRRWKSETTKTESVVSGAFGRIEEGLKGVERSAFSAEEAVSRLGGSLRNLENVPSVNVNVPTKHADFGARVKGPALVSIGNITEDVHFIPRSGPGAVKGLPGGGGMTEVTIVLDGKVLADRVKFHQGRSHILRTA